MARRREIDVKGTAVYVDGFNLYYGALKGTPVRWLDLGKFCDLALKSHHVTRICYCTALVKSRPENPTSSTDQQAYLRAIGCDPRVSIIHGQFISNTRVARRVPGGRPVRIKHVEEKGSDVNLATYLMLHAARGLMNRAVVISNDSDLVETVRIVQREFKISVGILNPHEIPSYELKRAASWMRPIRKGVLGAAQLPDVVEDVDGKKIRRPKGWDQQSLKRQPRTTPKKN